ncbi:MAG: polysaccharide biosynthesis tyrosine autokinase [Acinetobacter populi]|uniref:polysaccharide biosynthesis tyrosine autokinase n=1 Tax=Acinetobacter populi TaxID=1582270 RepID=UPI002353A2E7|nr:polysaccharide biosynthesis tyrosine autokinase [Acinetobacter populi]MCH4249011.1 polysaccharide biosynthesis tyrosine autokinase [Acinetobacter populi]
MTQNSQAADDTIDLKELLFSLIAQWKIITLCIILSLICALLYLRVASDVYSVDALVQVEDGKSAASAALLGQLGDLSSNLGGKSEAQAEIEILNSRMILGRVIKDLNLDIQIKDNQDTLLSRLISPEESILKYDNNGVKYQNNQSYFIIKTLNVPEYYQDKKLSLKFIDSNYFTISYKDAVLLKGILNQKNMLSSSRGVWTVQIQSHQIPKHDFTLTKQALPTAVKAIQDYYSAAEKGKTTGVIGLNYQGEDKTHITQVLNNILTVYHQQNIKRKSLESEQTLEFLNKKLPELKQQLTQAEIVFNDFRQKNQTVDVTAESELFLKQNIALETVKLELQQKQAEMAARYTPDHPLMAEINSQLKTVNNKIAELKQSINRLPELQRQYMQLYRDVEVQTELYTELLKSYQQLQVSKAGEIGSVRIIDTAVEPVKPIKPQKFIVLILSIFVGGFIGVLIALMRNILRTGIKDAAQIEKDLDLPVYATVPRSPIQESRISVLRKKKTLPILAVKHGDDIAIESLRSIRTAIHFALENAKNNIIMISGPAPELGKSFIATNLATIFAQNGKRTLLIDADLRRGYIHKYFNTDAYPGIVEYLTDDATLEQITYHSSVVENLSFISRGKSPKNPSELLSSQKFKDFLEQLSTQYDYIIIDTPPVLAVTDSIIISHYVGINLLLARFGKTNIKELELTVNRFEHAGSKVNGIIFNDVQRSSGSSYNYNYAYAYKAHKDD